MTVLSFPAIIGVGGASGLPLVRRESIAAPLVLSRAQTGAQATALAADGATITTFATGTARFNGVARRLLVEGQRTNEIAAPNNFSTGWSAISSGAGATAPVLTANYGPVAAPDGSFTATRIQANAGSSGFSGLTRTLTAGSVKSVWIRTVSGTARMQIANSGTLAQDQADITTTWQRIWRAATPDINHRILALSTVAGNSQTVDVLVWGAASEAGAVFPSSLILPPTGFSQVTTRGAEQVTAPLSAAGIGASGTCTILWSGVLPFIGASGADQTLIQVDDGSNNNRFRLRCLVGAGGIAAGRVTAGTAVDATSPGSVTAGTLFRAGITIAAGRLAASVNGGTTRSVTGGPTASLTTMRLGSDAVLGAGMFGETAALTVLPYALGDSQLAAAVAAMPG